MSTVFSVDLAFKSQGVGKLRNLSNQLQGVDDSAKGANRSLDKTAGAVRKLDAAFGRMAGLLAAGVAFGKIAQDALELDRNLRRLGTVGGDVRSLDEGLGRLSDRLDGVANKAELARASYQALSAGFTDTASNLKVVETATKAAVGGIVDVESVVEVTTKTLNAYGKSGRQAAQVTDSISKAIELGQVQWSDYTSQLGRVAGVAAVAGVSLNEVNAYIASATKNGATAEVAFTGLGSTIATLLKPTKETQEAAAQLGIDWSLAGVKAKGFSGLMNELAIAMQKNPEAASRLLGAQEAIRGTFLANTKGGKDYQQILESLGGAAGKTDKDFQTMKQSLENQLKALDTAFRNLGEALTKAFGPSVVDAVKGVSEVIKLFTGLVRSIPQPVANALGKIVIFTAKLWLMHKAITAMIGLRAGITGMLAATATQATAAGNASAIAAGKVRALAAALRTLAAIGIVTVGVEYLFNGARTGASIEDLNKRLEGGGTGAALKSGGKSTTREQVIEAQKVARETVKSAQAELDKMKPPGWLSALPIIGPAVIGQQGGRIQQLQGRIADAKTVLGLDANQFKQQAQTIKDGFDLLTEDDDKSSSGGSGKGEDLAKKLQESLKAGQELSRQFSRQIELRRATSDLERELLQIKYDAQDRQAQINELLDESQKAALNLLNTELQRLDTLKAITSEMENYWKSQVGEESSGSSPQFGVDKSSLEEWIGDSEQKLKDLLDPINQIKMGATLVGESFATAFGEVAKGTKTAQEAFSDMLKRMGDALIDYATTAIAQYIKIGIAKMFAGMLSGGSSGMNEVADNLSKNPLSSGKMFPSGVFAEGGYVTGPTNALIGEAGESEYVIPSSKMSSAMANYRAGKRGSSVIEDSSVPGGSREGGGNGTFTLETVVINNVEYATVAQVREMGAVAAKQGAAGGYAKTIGSMRNSRATRARLGMA